jgi:hypothetical protein
MFKLLEIVFDVASPGAFAYVKKTGSALKAILQNPLPFVGNLVNAAKLGFTNFAGNILTHLKKGLIDWLTGSLEGVYIPTALSLIEFGKMAISILGVSWAQIRGKIVKALGPSGEMIMTGLEAVFDVVMALINGGPKAAWEVIKDKLTSLKDTIVQGIISFVTEAIVTKAVPKLIAMFIPGAGFISAIISIYDIIKTFIEKLSKIAQVIAAFVNSIVAIAAGNIGAAAAKVESVLGGLLSLAISFLAGFVGLGKVSGKIRDVVKKVRDTVDKAIEAAVNWIVNKAKSLFASLFKAKDKKAQAMTPEQQLKAAMGDAAKLTRSDDATVEYVKAKLPAIQSQYGVKSLTLVVDGDTDDGTKAHIRGENSNPQNTTPAVLPKSGRKALVGDFEIPREKMSWRKSTKVTLALEFKGPASAVDIKTGKIKTKKKYGRRHIISFANIREHYLGIFPKTIVEDAVTKLQKWGGAQFTKKSVQSKVKSVCRQAFNYPNNLWIGLQAENSSLQDQVDPKPGWFDKGVADAETYFKTHMADFVSKWGVPGGNFSITPNADIQWNIDETTVVPPYVPPATP